MGWLGILRRSEYILIAVDRIKRTNVDSQSDSDQRHARTQRRISRLTQTTRPRTYGQPVQFSLAGPHQTLPRPLRARKHALRPPPRHRHSFLASNVRLPHRLALPTLLPNLRHRRHRIGNGNRRCDERRPQRDFRFRVFLPRCFPSCFGPDLRLGFQCSCAA